MAKRFSENNFFLAIIKGFLLFLLKGIVADYYNITNLVVIFYMIIDICLTKKNELTNNSMDFSISKTEKNYLLTKGKDFFKKFFENNNEKNKKKN